MCSQTEHRRVTADDDRWQTECRNHRPWPCLGLLIAEHTCGSTLSRVVDERAAANTEQRGI